MFAFLKFHRPTIQNAICAVSLIVVSFNSNCVAQEKFNLRIWSDSSGTFSVEAELIGYSTTEIELKKLNGVVIKVPVNRLSTFDNKFVRDLIKKRELARNPKAQRRTPTASQQIKSLTPVEPITTRKNTIPRTPSQQLTDSQPAITQTRPNQDTTPVRVKFGDSPVYENSQQRPPAVSNNDFDNIKSFSSGKAASTTGVESDDFKLAESNLDTAPKSGLFEALNGQRVIESSTELANKSAFKNAAAESEWSNFSDNANPKPESSGSILDLPEPRPMKTDESTTDEFIDIGSTANSNTSVSPTNLTPNVLRESTSFTPAQYSELASRISNLDDRTMVQESLNLLSDNWPSQPEQQLLDAVRDASKSQDARSRKLALDLMAGFDGQQSLPWILDSIDDKSFSVRWAAYAWLEKLQDVRSLEALCAKVKKDGNEQAAKTIASFGSVAEPNVMEMLQSKSYIVRKSACSLLAKIGSESSLMRLKDLAANGEKISVRMQASNAIETINKRLKR